MSRKVESLAKIIKTTAKAANWPAKVIEKRPQKGSICFRGSHYKVLPQTNAPVSNYLFINLMHLSIREALMGDYEGIKLEMLLGSNTEQLGQLDLYERILGNSLTSYDT